MDTLRRNAEAIASVISSDTRALWLAWVGDLLEYILGIETRILEMRSMLRDLSDRVTIAVYNTVRDAAHGHELRLSAIDEHLRHEVDRLSVMVSELSDGLLAVTRDLAEQTRHQDQQHIQLIGELMRLRERIDRMRSE